MATGMSFCPQCGAPLRPDARFCAGCGTPIRSSTTIPAQPDHNDSNFQKIRSKSKTALIVSLCGLPLCCFPVSLIGAGLGIQAMRMANAEKTTPPASAKISVAIGILTTILFVVAMVLYQKEQKKTDDRKTIVQKKLLGKRSHLDAGVACDLAEERLLETGYSGMMPASLNKVQCAGNLEIHEQYAMLPNIRAEFGTSSFGMTGCFFHAERWFVLSFIESGSCKEPPITISPLREGAGEAEILAQEKALREEYANADKKEVVHFYENSLSRIREKAAQTSGTEEIVCPVEVLKNQLHGSTAHVPTIDYDHLNNPSFDVKEWSWLTSSSMNNFLSTQDVTYKKETLESLLKEGAHLLVVYRSEGRVWPKMLQKEGVFSDDFSYDSGRFEGSLLVFNWETSELLCRTPLQFENSKEVKYHRRGPDAEKARVEDAIFDDFEENFENAATIAIRRISPDLKLGYKLLE